MSMNLLFTSRNYSTTSGKLTYPLRGNTTFSNKEVSLNAMTIYNSFFNVTSSIGNNTITLKYPIFTASNTYTMTDYICTLPNGFYTIDTLNEALNNFCINQGLYMLTSTGDIVTFQKIVRNPTLYGLQLNAYYLPTAAQSTTLGLTNPGGVLVPNVGNQMVSTQCTISAKLTPLVGISAATYPASPLVSTAATWPSQAANIKMNDTVPQVTPVTSIVVKCSLINNIYSTPTTLLCQVPMDAVFEQIVKYSAVQPLWSDVNMATSVIELSFEDQNGNTLVPIDSEICATLAIRDKVK